MASDALGNLASGVKRTVTETETHPAPPSLLAKGIGQAAADGVNAIVAFIAGTP
jgi:hypothetical protein